jgi:hypothetical protein
MHAIRGSLAAVMALVAGLTISVEPSAAGASRVRQANTSVRTSETTVRVESIDRSTRVITAVTPERAIHQFYVPPQTAGFEKVNAGDEVTVRFTDSTILRVNRSARPSTVADTTAEAQQQKTPGGDVVQQMRATVVIERIDRQTGVVHYRTADDLHAMYTEDVHLLDGIKPGDTIEMVYTRERAVSVTPAKGR